MVILPSARNRRGFFSDFPFEKLVELLEVKQKYGDPPKTFFFLFLTNRLWSVTVQCFLPSTVWEVSASVKLCFSLPTCLSPNFGTAVGPVNFYGRSKKRFRIFKLV